MKTKSFFALLLAGALFLPSCNKSKQEPNKMENGPQTVVVALDLGDNLRAAMTDGQDVIAAGGAASVESVDVYLTTGNGLIKVAQRFTKGNADFNKLTSAAAIGAATGGGYKFVNVDASVTRASVVVNPQAATLAVGTDVNDLEVSIKAKANEAVYSELNKPLQALGVEPINPDPATNANVKKVQFDLKGDMSRFQVATVFSVIEFKDAAAKQTFIDWKKQYIKDNPGAGRTYDDKDAAYVTAQQNRFGSFNNGNPTGAWLSTWKIVKVTEQNKGVFMNDFDNTLKLSTKTVDGRLFATTYAGAYTTTDGTLTIGGKNVTDFASYFNAAGFTTKISGTGAKVLAFNFFAKQSLTKDLKVKGNAPRLHFFFEGANVDADHQFVNLVGYDLGTETFKEAQLLNIDMSQINNGHGIIVQSDDPTVPGKGNPDIVSDKFNLIVRVTVAPWTAVNVTPIAE